METLIITLITSRHFKIKEDKRGDSRMRLVTPRPMTDTEELSIYEKYNSYLEEIYTLLMKFYAKEAKIRFMGAINKYVGRDAFEDPVVINNIADRATWRGYNILYIPSDVTKISTDMIINLGKKIIVIGTSQIDGLEIILSNAYDLKTEEIILACDVSKLKILRNAFDHTKCLRKIIIYGQTYNIKHELTEEFTPVTISRMFQNLEHLEKVIITRSNLSRLVGMDNLFRDCTSLQEVYIQNSEGIYELRNMYETFMNCRSAKHISLRGINTAKINNMQYILSGCTELISADLSTITIMNTYNLSGVFKDCKNLKHLNLKHWNFRDRILTINDMFTGCTSLDSTNNEYIDNILHEMQRKG